MSQRGYFSIAHSQGAEAKERGWERDSPYKKLIAEQYWLAGYDGIEFDKFHKFVRESRRATKSSLGYTRIGLNNV